MKQSTTRLKFAWLASVSGTRHVELDKLPDLSNTKSKRRLLVEFVFFRNSNQTSKCLMRDSLFDQSDATIN